MRWSVLLVLLVGCDKLLGIEDPHGLHADGGLHDGSEMMGDGGGGGDGGSGSGDGGMPTNCVSATPAFGAATSNGATGAVGVVATDVSNDGKVDLVVAMQTDVGVMFGTGNGTFGSVRKLIPGENMAADDVLVADIDGDGRPDVVSWSGGAMLASLHSTSSNTGFGSLDSIPSQLSVTEVFAGQFDGVDGVDLVITDGTKTELLLALGGVNFTVAASTQARAVAVGDVDGDGKLDVLLVQGTKPEVNYGDGAGGLVPAALGTGATTADRLAIADVGDPLPAVIATTAGGSVRILHQTAPRVFGAETILFAGLPIDSGVHAQQVIDANGDGRSDVIGNGALVTECAPPQPGGIAQMNGAPVSFGIASPIETVLADVNKDGKPDALQIDTNTTGVFVQLGQ